MEDQGRSLKPLGTVVAKALFDDNVGCIALVRVCDCSDFEILRQPQEGRSSIVNVFVFVAHANAFPKIIL